MSPSFLEIPDVPMEMIMNYLDYLSIRSVRKTCWDLRNFIDDKKPGICIKQIEICQESDTAARLSINEGMHIYLSYEEHENGCRIEGTTSYKYKYKIVENVNFLDAVLHDFKVALNFQKSVFEEVIITGKTTGKTFFEKIEEMMKSQKPLATEFIIIRRNSLEHSRRIIQHADPKYLKKIDIDSREVDNVSYNIIETSESSKNIQNLSHFITTSIQLENLDVERVRAIKENFLQFQDYVKYLIVLYVVDIVRENLFIDAFGAAFESPGENEEIWYFNVPGNKEKVLKVYNKYVLFEFKFVEKCEVPEGYVILN